MFTRALRMTAARMSGLQVGRSPFTGLRLTVTSAMVGAVVGELAGGEQGLGHVIVTSSGRADTLSLSRRWPCSAS
ncbi:hypothetical protein AB4Z54_20150 [Streptomyces sp. MCAF7]